MVNNFNKGYIFALSVYYTIVSYIFYNAYKVFKSKQLFSYQPIDNQSVS